MTTLSIELQHFFTGLVALLFVVGMFGLMIWIDERHRRQFDQKIKALNTEEEEDLAEEQPTIEKTHENEYDLEAWTHIQVGKYQTQGK